MKKILSTILLSLFLFSFIPIKADAANRTPNNNSKAAIELRLKERELWNDHVIWTRSFIVCDIASLDDEAVVTDRLLQNQVDIGNSIKPYYGEEAGDKLAELLKSHILLAAQVVNAARNKDAEELDKYNRLWTNNADEIAEFLSTANPNLSKDEVKTALRKHLDYVTKQTIARLNTDWKADIKAFDEGKEHVMDFSDALIEAIIKQFPEKFK